MLILPIRYAIPHTLSSSSPKIFMNMLLINDHTIYQLKKKSENRCKIHKKCITYNLYQCSLTTLQSMIICMTI